MFNDPATTEIYTLSLHDALPILERERRAGGAVRVLRPRGGRGGEAGGGIVEDLLRVQSEAGQAAALEGRDQESVVARSEEHTSELQSQSNLVCRLLLEKKKNKHK